MRILFVGLGGVPYARRAADVRLRFFADAIKAGGNEALVLNRYPFPQTKESRGSFSKIIELYSESTKKTAFLYFKTYFKEFWAVLKEHRLKKIDILHIYSGHFFDVLFYFFVSRIIGAKTVYSYVEFRSVIPHRGIYSRINARLIDSAGCRFMDGVIPISQFLEQHVKAQRGVSFPSCRIPPICDFDYFSKIPVPATAERYILFCGSAEYREVIDLILNAYLKTEQLRKKMKLKLVLGGKRTSRERLREEYPSDVEILSGLPYEELVRAYKGAAALLIPLRDSLQDKARFPNKICEYVASRGLIITTKFGEIPYFFEDGKTALIARDFTAEALSEKFLQFAEMSKQECEIIRDACLDFGRLQFDFLAYAEPLKLFFEKVEGKKSA